LQEILDGLKESRFNKVYATSFIRLLEQCSDTSKWEVMLSLTNHESPLVRSAAAHSLYANDSKRVFGKLLELVEDEYRLVRLNAAFALSSFPETFITEENRSMISEALSEYENSLITNPDDWSAHYNLGNYYSELSNFDMAIEAYNNSLKLYPEAIMPMVNAGYIYSLQGDYNRAEGLFTKALSYNPDNEAALLNLGLLYAESGNTELSKQYLRRLLEVSEKNAVAAYNLAVLESVVNIDEAVELSGKAMDWDTGNVKYAYTHAYYLYQQEDKEGSKDVLHNILDNHPSYISAYFLLSEIYAGQGNREKAAGIIRQSLKVEGLTANERQSLQYRLEQYEN
jgi:tetratricopeptide (TPR) repeat protein